MSSRAAIVLLLAVPALAQSPLWGQCGGVGWQGATTCASGSTCSTLNPYYSQCIPGGNPNPQPQPTTTTTPPAPPRTTTTAAFTTGYTPPPPNPTTSSAPVPNQPASCPAIPGSVTGSNSKLPDPFTFYGGGKVTTKAQFTCRQREISEVMQRMELGTKPGAPQSLTASFSGNKLTINVSDQGKSISFSVTITKPSGNGPFPAIIGYGGGNIPVPANVAKITYDNSAMGNQDNSGSRGKGLFYNLYGSGHSAGALTAWAWGVSRIIDALELTPAAGIDPKRVGVTGCSRNGKGAIVAGALDDRIALTIPQESGSGGSACWRLSDYQKSQGTNVQTASQIITENAWFGKVFDTSSRSVNSLPFDHHSLAGLVAPRGLIVIENTSMEWLGNLSTYGCMKAASLIYQALGVSGNMGYSQYGHSDHCGFPSAQSGDLNAFINKFLLNQSSANTNIFKTDGKFTFNQAQWVDWSVPTLS